MRQTVAVATPVATDWTPRLAGRTQGEDGALTDILALANATDMISFSGGFPAPEVFPAVAGLAAQIFAKDAATALQYSPSQGIAGTLEAVGDLLAGCDGLRPGPGELMITSGGIDAVTLIGRTMLDRGDLVAVEDPTYLGAITGFANWDAGITGLAMDADGLVVDALAELVAAGRIPKLVYVIPEYQNPTGRVLGTARRHELVELCRRHAILIVEDVAYRELGFGTDRRPSLWSLAPDCVVQIGTFSKTFFPGVRLGWAAGPAPVIARLVVAKQNSDQCAGAFGQRLVERFLRAGLFPAQLDRERALYRERGQAMHAALRAHLPADATWDEPAGGFFCWLGVPGVDCEELARRAAAAGVGIVGGTPFFAARDQRSFARLSYSRATPEQIDSGVATLAATIERMRTER